LKPNSFWTYGKSALFAVASVEPSINVTSREIDDRLAPALRRMRLPKGLLTRVAGVKARRHWADEDEMFRAVTEAGNSALKDAGITADDVGLLINTSITRPHLEPSVAVRLHESIGLPPGALNFDITNACLGFVNGITLAASMIEAGQVEHALIVNGENAGHLQDTTMQRLLTEDLGREEFLTQFATLTLGSGAVAAVVSRSDLLGQGHRLVRGVARAATQYNALCIGDENGMTTHSAEMLEGAMKLISETWSDASRPESWSDMDRYFIHQVSKVHTGMMADTVGIDHDRVPVTYPHRGNVGPASIPITLAEQQDTLRPGDRVLLAGVGSGMNASMLELTW